nr:hypothetical protein [Tanacetum cinerariifolium]
MLRVFPFTLTGAAKRWVDRLTLGIGLIPRMTPAQALTTIQTMTKHSQKWHDGTSSRSIGNINNTDRLAAIECPLNEEVNGFEDVKYGKFGRLAPFNRGNEARFHVGASVNVMPRGIFEYLKLTNLRNTNMLVEMANMTKKAPLGVVKNILVQIDKFLFNSDFVIIDKTPNKTIILGRTFLPTIHAKINVFDKEVSLGIGNDMIISYIKKKDHNFTILTAKILMVNSIIKDEPSYPSDDPSLKSLKSDNLLGRFGDDVQEQHVKKKIRLNENIPVKHFCKPIMQKYNGKVRMWPTCDPAKSMCDVGVKVYEALLELWLIDCFEDEPRNPCSRSFDDYQWVFDLEIDQVADEYELGIGKKGHILKEIWENYNNVPRASTTLSYSSGSSTPPSYSLGSSRNAECSNCIILLGKIKVLEATVEMYRHLEQHTLNSTALLHEVYNDIGKLGLG